MCEISNLIHHYNLTEHLFHVKHRIICSLEIQCVVDNSISQYCRENKFLGIEGGRTEESSLLDADMKTFKKINEIKNCTMTLFCSLHETLMLIPAII